MKVQIDPGAGPCFGVKRAIKIAKDTLEKKTQLLCVGDLIHNEQEINRLKNLGLKTLSLAQAINSSDQKILFRAHGEPPSSYKNAERKGKTILDATCPIVASLQKEIQEIYRETQNTNAQIVIFGNRNHPEIISLLGFCEGKAIIIEKTDDLNKVNDHQNIHLFSQTTQYNSNYLLIKEAIIKNILALGLNLQEHFFFHDSSCKIVAQRDEQLKEFFQDKDIILFVSGKKSSNGKQLFKICQQSGIESYFISQVSDINPKWFQRKENMGISGATSTPYWLLEDVKNNVEKYLK
ncbi:MAG: 4-hydroxy-3-methylbut-2-enyl diphosphate reductase [Bacteroidales bacterium]|nr:4-hydroxy-3-methylbut-2-enyl diphosphate reductase [Bacteroidales bacterium]